jgi:hypothetical protein
MTTFRNEPISSPKAVHAITTKMVSVGVCAKASAKLLNPMLASQGMLAFSAMVDRSSDALCTLQDS